jgi:hypothetical protein
LADPGTELHPESMPGRGGLVIEVPKLGGNDFGLRPGGFRT